MFGIRDPHNPQTSLFHAGTIFLCSWPQLRYKVSQLCRCKAYVRALIFTENSPLHGWAQNKMCGLFWVTRSWFPERDIAVNFLESVLRKHHLVPSCSRGGRTSPRLNKNRDRLIALACRWKGQYLNLILAWAVPLKWSPVEDRVQ